MSANGAMLVVRGLCVSYGNIGAVRDLSFEVNAGEIVTLIGANGAGKSTTLRAISGIVPWTGEISFEGQSLNRIPPEAIVAAGIVQVPEGRGIFGNLTVLENLRLATWQRRDRGEFGPDLQKVFAYFPRLAERRHQAGGTLSGGEQQMLAVGRALMSRPRLMLLDEPSMGLAPIMVGEIFRVVREINAEGTTILLVEQNAGMALRVASRAYVLETGSITISGTGRELLGDPRVRDAYLGG
jgi:branched-chain amino acid transport system ATP-binding protein